LLGFGHIEIGTLTPAPQSGNPRPRVFRLTEDRALVNRMGFPNEGVAAAALRLQRPEILQRNYVLGVSLGKQKDTPLTEAARDYKAVMRSAYPVADYLAVNISSPNTPGLRELQGGRYLYDLLEELIGEGKQLAAEAGIYPRPLWVKVAPDMSNAELDDILDALESAGVNGIIVANTTLSRDGLSSTARNEAGGLSGHPLRKRTTELIAHVHKETLGTLPIIGVGGIGSAADVIETLAAGASVVQLYTAMIYDGPGLPGRILRDLARLLS
jgi:dihydroorotate dehydrogenase